MAGALRCRGFTLTELLVVLAVIVVSATLAGPSFKESLERARLKEKAGAVVGLLEFAKSEGIKRSAVTTTIAPASGSAPWKVTAAIRDGNTVVESRSVDGSAGSVSLQSPTATSTITLDFRGLATGFLSTSQCDDTDTGCIELRSSSSKYRLRIGINPAGLVLLCAKGAPIGGYRSC